MLLTIHAFAILRCLHESRNKIQTVAESYSSIERLGRDDIFQVSLLNLVKHRWKKGEKLYRKA